MQKGTWVGYLWGWWMKMEIGDSGTCSEKDNQKNTGGGDKEHERRMDTQRERETRRGGGAGEQGAGQGQVGRGVQHPNFGGGSRSLPYCIHQGFHQY